MRVIRVHSSPHAGSIALQKPRGQGATGNPGSDEEPSGFPPGLLESLPKAWPNPKARAGRCGKLDTPPPPLVRGKGAPPANQR